MRAWELLMVSKKRHSNIRFYPYFILSYDLLIGVARIALAVLYLISYKTQKSMALNIV